MHPTVSNDEKGSNAGGFVLSYNRLPSLEHGLVLANDERTHIMPRGRRTTPTDASLLEAALIGFEQMRRNVEENIAYIRRLLGSGGGTQAGSRSQRRKRKLSLAARRRIAAAQRKRWAAVKARPKPTNTKRTMSAAARKRIAAAQRKRWALVKAKKGG